MINYYRLLEYSISKIIARYGTSEECGVITIVFPSLGGVGKNANVKNDSYLTNVRGKCLKTNSEGIFLELSELFVASTSFH